MCAAFLAAERVESWLVVMGAEIVLVLVGMEGLLMVGLGVDRVGLLLFFE